MKKIATATLFSLVCILLYSGIARAQTASSSPQVSAPTLYNQSGREVNGYDDTTQALIPGWYYSKSGAPLYYYANGAYYNPETQSYGGSVLYPSADGPIVGQNVFTPGVPNTGAGGQPLTMVLALLVSGGVSVAGTIYLSRRHLI